MTVTNLGNNYSKITPDESMRLKTVGDDKTYSKMIVKTKDIGKVSEVSVNEH